MNTKRIKFFRDVLRPVASNPIMKSSVYSSEPASEEALEMSGSPPVFENAEFAQIYEDQSRSLYYLSLRMLSDPVLAEDAVHDVFLKAYRKMHQFQGRSSPKTWLYRITINHCRNLLKKRCRSENYLSDKEGETEVVGFHNDTPYRIIEKRELGQRIQKALDRLTEEYRLLLLLVADRKLSYEEVAELTDQSVDAVRGKLYRARKAFAAIFKNTD